MTLPEIHDAPTPMLKQYLEIKHQHLDAILFYRLGDFYEMFYDDAVLASRVLDIILTTRNKNDPNPVPLCGIPFHSAEPYLTKLLAKGHKVAICEQMEDPATAKGVVRREVARVLTPGVVIESTHLDAKRNNYIAALVFQSDEWGLAFSDISTGVFFASRASDAHSALQELSRFEVSEVLVPASLPLTELQFFQEQLAALFTIRPVALFRAQDLAHFPGSKEVRELSEAALCAASGIWNYFNETQKTSAQHVHRLELLSTRGEMRLDLATRRNLELVETLHEGERWGTLLWFLDHCETAMGSRLLRSWILAPLTDRAEIEARLSAVEQLKLSNQLSVRCRAILSKVYDLERINSRVVMGVANARDCIALAHSLELLPELKQLLVGTSGRLGALGGALDALQDLRALIVQRIHPEPPLGLRDGKLICAGYSAELDELNRLSHSGKEFISQLEAEEQQKTGISKLKVGFNRVFGYYIEISNTAKDKVPAHYIRKQTLANCERYITPELKSYEEKVLGAEDKAKALELQLFVELREQLAKHGRRIQQTASLLSELDVYSSLAKVAAEQRFVKPQLSDAPVLELTEARHPIVEALGKERFVPNSLNLGAAHGRLMMITGPNMAGKSTIMRQTALVVLLAQMGSFVPASHAHIGIVDRIFTRVGAADALALGQSTFMVEMAETALILHQATARSLVLVDEIGRGTSTFDGLAIAWSVAEDLHDRVKARTLFATHYHELAALAEQKDFLRNYHVAVQEDGGKIVFLRKLVPGHTSHSYGLHVASLAGLPAQVVERAKQVLARLEKQSTKPTQYQLFQNAELHDRPEA